MSPKPLLDPQTKDATCTVRERVVDDGMLVRGFVRVLDHCEHDGDMFLLMLTDADPIVWRLSFVLVGLDEPHECLTGLTYVGRWNGDAVFMHPPTRADEAESQSVISASTR